MEYAPPPRHGDWSSVNRHLTAGGTVEGIVRENPYLPYIKQLMEKKQHFIGTLYGAKLFIETNDDSVVRKSLELLERVIKVLMLGYGDLEVCENPCSKPHNNGEDTCNECLIIKEGI